MRPWRAPLFWILSGVAIAASVGVGLAVWRGHARARAEVTFTKDIAPLVFARCAPCHRPGEAGPFSLLTYEDVSKRAAQIQRVTRTRFMPPWKPVHGTGPYANDRSLDDAQIDLIDRWVREGAKLGEPGDLPPAPVWSTGYRLGEPDVVVELTEPYVLAADATDVYRNFVIPSPVVGTSYVTAWEFRPGSRAIHHAILNIDRLGVARRRDAEDPGPGFDGMDSGGVQSPDGFYLVWAPGKVPAPPQPGMSWRLDARTDLVLQLHMQPTGKSESIHPKVALYLSDRPPTIPRFALYTVDPPIDIQAGDAHYAVHSDYSVAADVAVLSVMPHAHYLAKTISCVARLPDGSVRPLVRIDDWDFNWQDEYTFTEPLRLPAGTKIELDITYDNSDANPHNPSHPPVRVRGGPRSVDEMGNAVFQVVPRDASALLQLRKADYAGLLVRNDLARNHYNLANVLADEGEIDEAIAHYRRAIEEDPKLASAYFNMANLLLRKGDRPAAIAAYEAAIEAKPDSTEALINLGHAVESDRPAEAMTRYRQALAIDPRSALAHDSLAAALSVAGDRAGAIEQFGEGLRVEPGNATAHFLLSKVLREDGQSEAASAELRRARELDPRLPAAP